MAFIGNQPTAVPLTSSQLADGLITTDKLAASAVTSAKILDSTIVNADIASTTINLTQKVTGTLPVANGGTGLTALGTSLQVLRTNTGATALEFATVSDNFSTQLFHVRDEKSSGTNGGTSQTSFTKRDLNTSVTNEISGASLASSVITLPSGTYYISAFAPAYSSSRSKLKLRNTTDSSDTLIGTSEYSDNGNAVSTMSFVTGRFTIAAQKNFELQHKVSSSTASNGFGVESGSGLTEVYTDCQIWKVA